MTISLVESLDQQAADGAFPWWDHAKKLTCAMRAYGFTTAKGPILAFSVAAYVASEAALERSLYAFGAIGEPGRIGREWLGDDDAFEAKVDDQTVLVKATGVRMQPSKARATRPTVTPARLDVRLGGKTYALEATSADLKAAARAKLSPSEVMAIVLAGVARDALLAPAADITKQLGLPPSANPLFVVDDWQHPSAADEKASASPDIVEMCRALERGDRPRLSGKPNGSPSSWAAERAAMRTENDLGWGGTWSGGEADNGKATAKPKTKPTPKPKAKPAKKPAKTAAKKSARKKTR